MEVSRIQVLSFERGVCVYGIDFFRLFFFFFLLLLLLTLTLINLPSSIRVICSVVVHSIEGGKATYIAVYFNCHTIERERQDVNDNGSFCPPEEPCPEAFYAQEIGQSGRSDPSFPSWFIYRLVRVYWCWVSQVRIPFIRSPSLFQRRVTDPRLLPV